MKPIRMHWIATVAALVFIAAFSRDGEAQSISFMAPQMLAAGDSPFSVVAADLDGNGHLDLVVANNGSGRVLVLLKNQNGFYAVVGYSVGDHPRSIVAVDLDGDGDLDLVVADDDSGDVSVLKNYGRGIFVAAENYRLRIAPWSVFAADHDGDANNDGVTDARDVAYLVTTAFGGDSGQVNPYRP